MDVPLRRVSVWKISIQADEPVVSLGLECIKISFPSPSSLSFLSLESRPCFPPTLSLLTLSVSLACLPSTCLRAAYKHTAHFCLADRRLACSLEPAAED